MPAWYVFLRPFAAFAVSIVLSCLASATTVYTLTQLGGVLMAMLSAVARMWRWIVFALLTFVFTGFIFSTVMQEGEALDAFISATLSGASFALTRAHSYFPSQGWCRHVLPAAFGERLCSLVDPL